VNRRRVVAVSGGEGLARQLDALARQGLERRRRCYSKSRYCGRRSDQIVLHLTRPELLLLAGSVNEAIEAVDDWEFSTRLGADKADARALQTQLGDLITRLPPE
jgi:hypothetical protein